MHFLINRFSHRTAPRVAAGLAFALFVTQRLISMSPPTGDEPHYLVLAESVVRDGDLKVANNYAQENYRDYYPGALTPHVLGGDNPHTRRYSPHAPGLALIIAPAFAVFAYWGATALLAAVAALGTAFVWSGSYLLTRSLAAAWFGWAVVTLTVPMALFGSLIYPDPVAATAVAIGVWAITRSATAKLSKSGPSLITDPPSARIWSSAILMGVSGSIALLPWLHTRLAILAALLAVVLLPRIWADSGARRLTHVCAFVLPLIVSSVVWLIYVQLLFGSIDPRSPFGGHLPVSDADMINGLAGIFADQEFGLLTNAPVYIVAFSGVWLLWRRNARLAAEIAVIAVPYTLVIGGFRGWSGGHCPPARLVLPVLLPFGATAALVWSASGINGRRIALVLLAASVALVSLMTFVQAGALAYNDGDGSARWIEWLTGGTNTSRLLPSFVGDDP